MIQFNTMIVLDEKGFIRDLVPLEKYESDLEGAEYYEGIITPGFVNSHCHLEFSWALGFVQLSGGIKDFIRQVGQLNWPDKDIVIQAIKAADEKMQQEGIVAVADISNSNITFGVKEASPLFYHTFIELFASDPLKSNEVFEKGLQLADELKAKIRNNTCSITPHAPYSVSSALFGKIKNWAEANNGKISLHHQESESENELFLYSKGPLMEHIDELHIPNYKFINAGEKPLRAIKQYLPKNNPLMLVHNTFSDKTDIQFAYQYFEKVYFCFCPNSNVYIEKSLPDISLFEDYTDRLLIGTDSLASNHTLSILEEIKALLHGYPYFPIEQILQWATYNGACFLGIQDHLGQIKKGYKPGLVQLKGYDFKTRRMDKNASLKLISESEIL
ncbi:MAG: amidohydrolase family protein [Bacteroidales bacterium]|nr:amidohydrolase family protein [Bacteroidales bacterium]